jgi:hypothetical protein
LPYVSSEKNRLTGTVFVIDIVRPSTNVVTFSLRPKIAHHFKTKIAADIATIIWKNYKGDTANLGLKITVTTFGEPVDVNVEAEGDLFRCQFAPNVGLDLKSSLEGAICHLHFTTQEFDVLSTSKKLSDENNCTE